MLPTFSYVHEAYIDYEISLTIFEMQHFDSGWIIIVPHLLRYGALVFTLI